MQKQVIYIYALCVFTLMLGAASYTRVHQHEKNPDIYTPHICVNKHCYEVEIADTNEKRRIGLMQRTSLGAGSGMIFVFDDLGIYSFWMKNTLIPLDILWLDASGKVLEMVTATPCKQQDPTETSCITYGGNYPARYVLELNAGQAKEKGIYVGSSIDFYHIP